MIVYFDQCDVVVDRKGILAQSANLESENSLSPVYGVGKIGIANQAPSAPLKSSFSFDYYIETDNEPNYNITKFLKSFTSGQYFGCQIILGGITGSNCFLDSYSIKAQPNQIVTATAKFSTFLPVLGEISRKEGNVTYNVNNNLAHGWTTFLTNSGHSQDFPTYSFEYTLDVLWQPVYKIGSKYPSEVKLMSMHEQMGFEKDFYKDIRFSGEYVWERFMSTGDLDVDLFDISLVCSDVCSGLNFDLTDAKVKTERVSASIDDFVRSSIQINKYF